MTTPSDHRDQPPLSTPWFTQIRNLATLIVAAFIFLLVGTAFLFYGHHKQTLHRALAEDRATARLISLVLEEHFQRIVGIMQSYAGRPLLEQAVAAKDVGKARPHLSHMLDDLPLLQSTIATDPKGTVWIRHPVLSGLVGQNLAYRDWYKGISAGWKPYISEVFIHIIGHKEPAVNIAVPVFSANGRVVGLLSGVQRMTKLKEIVAMVPLGTGVSLSLADRHGHWIFSSRSGPSKKIAPYPLYHLYGKGEGTTEAEAPLFESGKGYLSFAPAPTPQWAVFVERDAGSILWSEKVHYMQMGAIALLLFLIFSLSLVYLRRHILNRQMLEQFRMEKRLKEGEIRYRALFDHSNEAMFLTVPEDGSILDANPAACRMFGRTLDEIRAVGRAGSVDLTDTRFRAALKEREETGFSKAEFTMVRASGEKFPVEVASTIFVNGGGRRRSSMIVRDISERRRTEEALRERDLTYRKLSLHVPGMIYQLMRRPDGTYCLPFTTDAIRDIFGCSAEAVRDGFAPIVESVLPADIDGLIGSIESSAEQMTLWEHEFRVRIPGRPVRWILGHSTPEKLPDGGILWHGFATDVTERKIAEEELRANRKHLSDAMEMARLGHWEYDPAADLFTFNDQFYKIFRTTAEEVGGYTMRSAEYARRFVHPDDIEVVVMETRKAIETSDPNFSRQIEHRMLYANGETGYISVRFFIAKDAEGLTIMTYGVNQDITERVRAQEALRRAEEKYRGIFENAQEGIFRSTADGRIILANEAMSRMFGYDSPDEMMSSITDASRQLYVDPDECVNVLAKVEEQGQLKGYETRLYRKDGSTFWISMTIKPRRDASGHILYYEGIAEDVTERKEHYDRLRKALGATVQAISQTVEVRDPYTAGHQRRVSDLARAIATEMGWPADRIDGIRMAGFIHDLGKIAVAAEILSKPSRLTDLEYALIKIHPQIGYNILKDIEFPWPISRMILEHHERMDGSGYPGGLKGEETLPESRILAVADVVESMASHRPYRPAIGLEAALKEIDEKRGSLYDPGMADACLALFRKGYQLPE